MICYGVYFLFVLVFNLELNFEVTRIETVAKIDGLSKAYVDFLILSLSFFKKKILLGDDKNANF